MEGEEEELMRKGALQNLSYCQMGLLHNSFLSFFVGVRQVFSS